jgi:hypothetical protein
VSVAEYVASVDRLLTQAHELFPAGGDAGAAVPAGRSGGSVPGASAGGSALTAGAGLAGDVYTRGQTVVAALDAGAGEAATEAAAIGAEGFSGSGVIRDQARAQAAAIAPMANSAAGMRLMVSTMDTNMAAMQQQLKTTSIHNQVSSARLRQIAAGYRTQTDFLGSGEEPATGGVVKDAGVGTDLMPEGIGPPTVIDPANPFVGDERFGHWQNYTPPPHVGDTPPPPFEHRSLEGLPAKEGGPSGFYTPGRTWLDDSSAPWASLAEQYKFRISGEDLTSYTRTATIDGHQQLQRWVGYTYEAQRTTQVDLNGDIWAKSGPDEAQRALGGTTTGGIGGLVTPPKFGEWQPITPNQMANLSTLNPTVTYYIPDGCGNQFTFVGGQPIGGVLAPPPTVPQIIRPR